MYNNPYKKQYSGSVCAGRCCPGLTLCRWRLILVSLCFRWRLNCVSVFSMIHTDNSTLVPFISGQFKPESKQLLYLFPDSLGKFSAGVDYELLCKTSLCKRQGFLPSRLIPCQDSSLAIPLSTLVDCFHAKTRLLQYHFLPSRLLPCQDSSLAIPLST